MEYSGLSDKSKAFQYAILSTRISQILKKIETGLDLKPTEYDALDRGANLLRQIVEGSILVEGRRMHGFSASQEGLSAYGHALSALKSLDLLKQNKEYTNLFLDFHKAIVALVKKEHIDDAVVANLRSFFDELADFVNEDLHRSIYGKLKNKKPTHHSIKSIRYVFA